MQRWRPAQKVHCFLHSSLALKGCEKQTHRVCVQCCKLVACCSAIHHCTWQEMFLSCKRCSSPCLNLKAKHLLNLTCNSTLNCWRCCWTMEHRCLRKMPRCTSLPRKAPAYMFLTSLHAVYKESACLETCQITSYLILGDALLQLRPDIGGRWWTVHHI